MNESINKNARGQRRFVNAETFWQRIQKPVGCWLYDGCKETNGYGYLMNPFGSDPKFITAHRAAWIFSNGQVPDGLLVLHKCDIRACVNPEHLYLGTDADNGADKMARERQYRGEAMHNAKLTEAAVREIRRDFRAEHKRKTNARELAARYGVTTGAIHAVITGRMWKHVA